MGFRCVHCGFEVRALFIQYSPGNIRLTKCGRCGAVADEYVECEYMILLIDLILHKAKAYRHLLYNFPNRNVVNLEGIGCKQNSRRFGIVGKFLSITLYLWKGALLLGTKILQKSSSEILRFKEVLLAIIVSSYFKIFLITMMIWEFPLSVLFIIDLFVLSSNAVALKVLTNATTNGCIGVCLTAHAAKYFVSHMKVVLGLGFLRCLGLISC
ncbi:protein arv1 homolog isoform X4 [Amborella trichopoda]|uniref:protein arv1 homolog isoform X4 n=1 Tax=Amborella trichopoda TaxID=13333 RepID=UPI0005D2E3FE|nr:protein arv1 homolog isoform X4 [Amborella trichopoda]|eukprot:XP_011628583.1 protein arv1 homolog isoform X4 [Amborella trichopoda]